jgi:hypothetical protein
MTKKISDEEFEDTIDKILIGEWLNGQAVGWDDAALYLISLSGDAFKAHRDSEANTYRNLADEFKSKATDIRKKYAEDKRQKIQDEAIQKLEDAIHG